MSEANNIRNAAKNLSDAVRRQMTLEKDRAAIKLAAISRIIASGDNPLTGKPHSFSSADAVVHTDADYDNHLSQLVDATCNKLIAVGEYDAAIAESNIGRSIKND
jgi:hypothetical protein